MKLPCRIARRHSAAAPVPHWCRKIGQKPSNSAHNHKDDNALNHLISQHESRFIKTGKTIGRVAHNLKVVSSNLAPATNLFKDLAVFQISRNFAGAALVPQNQSFARFHSGFRSWIRTVSATRRSSRIPSSLTNHKSRRSP